MMVGVAACRVAAGVSSDGYKQLTDLPHPSTTTTQRQQWAAHDLGGSPIEVINKTGRHRQTHLHTTHDPPPHHPHRPSQHTRYGPPHSPTGGATCC